MLIQRFYDDKLAQASYLVGCAATGEALVVDPNRDVQQYVAAAKHQSLRLTHVTETHIHADFVSGARELAACAGARLYLSAEGASDWQYAYAQDAGAVLLRDGASFRVGNIRIDALHTPGHTPEHLTFLVTDTLAADRPLGAFSGDFIFVGDVGRPDLLETAAGVKGAMEPAARELFRSLQRFRQQPDYLQIWPAHGAGSACGKAIGAVPQSTLGYEKLFSWAFQIDAEDAFVRAALEGQPEPPRYFAVMKRLNREGPPVLGSLPRPPRLPDRQLADVVEAGALVVDVRSPESFARGHVPGTINLSVGGSFTTWAGSLLPYDRDLYLISNGDNGAAVHEAVRDLTLIGLDRLPGYFDARAVSAWVAAGRPLETVASISAAQLAERLGVGDPAIIDVRRRAEWEGGHLPGVANVPLAQLAARLDEIPRDRPVVVHCQTGVRSAIAASILQAAGIKDVRKLAGDFEGWRAGGYPIERNAASQLHVSRGEHGGHRESAEN